MTSPLRLLGVLLCGGCQFLSGVDDLRIEAEADRWRCLRAPEKRALVDPIQYEEPVRGVGTNLIVPDAVAHFCPSADEACANPVIPPTAVAEGVLRFEISGQFDGYLKLESDLMLPAIVELSRPLGTMRDVPELRMLDALSLGTFASKMNANVDPELGHALFWVSDCDGNRANGVSLEAQLEAFAERADTVRYYVIDGRLPSITVDRTDPSGGGGFINLPTTFVTFQARLASTDEEVSTFSARIRRGHVTFFIVEPD